MRRRLTIMGALFATLLAFAPAQVMASEKFIVFFHPLSAELDPAARDVVAAAIAYAKQNPAKQVDIIGSASTVGSQQANLQLSLLRAQQIKDLMAADGIAPARLMRVGEGEVNTVGTAEEARRVEIIIRTP